ncbi:DUF6702 family protein [Flavobacterium sp. RSSA_27]|uniref:DUF6702 family protein n=1 Tax=Flavobacterium sp. RSSA_27 TaxID=3447667 RepID=UPI003F3EF79F
MKKTVLFFALFFLTFSLSSFEMHKFYVAIFQVQFVPEKKRIQITSRIFLDDLNKALEKKYHQKTTIGIGSEKPEDLILLKKYFAENLKIKLNNQQQSLNYISSEVEEDVLVSYLSIKEITKFQNLSIQNSLLMDWNSEQQNIMHFTANGVKNSLNFTDSSKSQMLKY